MALPHLTVPLRLVNGSFATAEQDTLAELESNVEVILRTPVGTRPLLPEFGVPDVTFLREGADPTVIEQAVTRWEPRATVTVTDVDDDPGVQLNDVIEVRVG